MKSSPRARVSSQPRPTQCQALVRILGASGRRSLHGSAKGPGVCRLLLSRANATLHICLQGCLWTGPGAWKTSLTKHFLGHGRSAFSAFRAGASAEVPRHSIQCHQNHLTRTYLGPWFRCAPRGTLHLSVSMPSGGPDPRTWKPARLPWPASCCQGRQRSDQRLAAPEAPSSAGKPRCRPDAGIATHHPGTSALGRQLPHFGIRPPARGSIGVLSQDKSFQERSSHRPCHTLSPFGESRRHKGPGSSLRNPGRA
mmetsp:Transcript_22378/g.42192  ORF Transcript_22378/g.42192 Transcript_22378/m.42192 type:complete len:254 (-) Transcript_22378:361-1122(-)